MEYPDTYSTNDSPPPPEEDSKVNIHAETLMKSQHELLDWFIDEYSMSAVTQFGREIRYGELEELGLLETVSDEFKVVTTPGLDIFGQPISKNTKSNFECECPKCKRTLAAARFAQHLEKCMGMGRNSSRIASRRLAAASTANSSNSGGNNASSGNHASASATSQDAKSASQGASGTCATANGDLNLGTDDEHFSEDDDEEWTMEKKKKAKKSSDKGTPKRKGAASRLKTADALKRKAGSPSLTYNESPASGDYLGTGDEDFNMNVIPS